MKNVLCTLLLLCGLVVGLQAQRMSGNASYYADRFDGKPTSTGETYNKKAFTAASKEFPAGTVLRVTNVANNLVTQVRVNDCGPHHPERIIDLSRAAAEQIGLLRAGVAVVRLELLSMGTEGPTCDRSKIVSTTAAAKTDVPANAGKVVTPPVAKPPAPASYGQTVQVKAPADPNANLPVGDDPIFYLYGVQVAAYGKAANAADFMQKSGDKYGFLFKRTDKKLTKVFVGPYLTETEAKAKIAELKKQGMNGILRRVQ